MILMTKQFEIENAGYLDQYKYSIEKNESGNYKSNDTQILYYGWRQCQPEISQLKAAVLKLSEALEKSNKSASFFSQHADCRRDTWACKCSFCKDTNSSRYLREARETLAQFEELLKQIKESGR